MFFTSPSKLNYPSGRVSRKTSFQELEERAVQRDQKLAGDERGLVFLGERQPLGQL